MLESKLLEHLTREELETAFKVVQNSWDRDVLMVPPALESLSKEDWMVVSVTLEDLLDEKESQSLH